MGLREEERGLVGRLRRETGREMEEIKERQTEERDGDTEGGGKMLKIEKDGEEDQARNRFLR